MRKKHIMLPSFNAGNQGGLFMSSYANITTSTTTLQPWNSLKQLCRLSNFDPPFPKWGVEKSTIAKIRAIVRWCRYYVQLKNRSHFADAFIQHHTNTPHRAAGIWALKRRKIWYRKPIEIIDIYYWSNIKPFTEKLNGTNKINNELDMMALKD